MPNEPLPYPRVAPYLLYEDVPAALAWLSRAFGFKERLRFTGDDGTVNHAEMETGDGLIMMGDPGEGYRNPRHGGGVTVEIHVYVDDVERQFELAKEAGATMVTELEDHDYGDRRFTADDLEGHRWMIAQHVRDVAPQDWGAVQA